MKIQRSHSNHISLQRKTKFEDLVYLTSKLRKKIDGQIHKWIRKYGNRPRCIDLI